MRLILIGFCITLARVVLSANETALAEAALHFLFVDGMRNHKMEPRDQKFLYKEYDFIVVGAGSAGCVVANRLSEIPEWKVLLIEAGGEESIFMDIPVLVNYWQFSKANWKYITEPSSDYCLGMENSRCHWPRGKVMGGSSVLNYMIYTRGNRMDYDRWEKMGNKGWGWDSVLPYFKKLEDMSHTEFAMHKEPQSKPGYMSVTNVPYRTSIGSAFVESGKLLGYPELDYNMPYHNGFNHLLVSMKNGSRWSSSKAYMYSAKNRPNLHVKKNSFVTKVMIDPATKTATGVKFVSGGITYSATARKEVILSGGTINSAQLLMLSGVGPKKHLRKKQIDVIKDAKVGYNLHDHYLPGGLTYFVGDPSTIVTSELVKSRKQIMSYLTQREGQMTSPGGCEAVGFVNVDNTTKEESPNMEILFILASISSDDTVYVNFNLKKSIYNEVYEPYKDSHSVMVFPILLSSRSRGRILLQDNNPYHHPLIYPKYFSDPEGYDMKNIIAGIRLTNKIMAQAPLKRFGIKPLTTKLPPCKHLPYDSDAYWDCYSRHMTFTIYHPVGTCKMGPDSDRYAVVDDRLRVKGIRNLRVIDASIMPEIVRAHTNAPTYMIAEKGSDMIKEDWGVNIKN